MDIKHRLTLWIEYYLFYPNFFQRFISLLFLPLTLIYCLVVAFKRYSNSKQIDFGVDIISVGNIVVGGVGKTPIILKLAKNIENVAIILRGYKRKTKGLIVVKKDDSVNRVGDEALLYKIKLPNSIVIVSEDRIKGILKAKELGAKTIFLDDGFRFNNIKKYDILIRPHKEPTNDFCLPSGGYKEAKFNYSLADLVLVENKDFIRKTKFIYKNRQIDKLPKDFILVSAISKPNRLLQFIPTPKKIYFFPDHYNFSKKDIEKFKNKTILTTYKDYVKLKDFNLDIVLLDLDIEFLREIRYK